jgi:acetoacetate decarboxylase
LRFVKTNDEIRRIQSIYSRCQYLATRNLTVLFETTPEAVRALLPPPLEPTPEALGTASVGEIANSNCVGPFTAAALYLRARYEDIVGNYCIAMAASTPEAVTFGREFYGEPGKPARLVFDRQGEFVWGSAERHDIRYLSLRGRLVERSPAGRQATSSFHFKFMPRGDTSGFDGRPLLVHVTADAKIDKAERGRGEIIFRDSPHDPLDDIPVTQVIEALYTEGQIYKSARVLCEVDPDAFLPYAFAGLDALDVMREGTFLHAQAARKSRTGRGQWRNGP